MNLITANGVDYTAPSGWKEISGEQLITWLKICTKKITDTMALRLAAIAFYQMKKELFFKLNAAQQVFVIDTLTFLVEGNQLIYWLIPSIKINGTEYLGPVDRLSNSTIKEFRATELFYSAYLISRDEKMLDQLIAALYRPTGANHPENDWREPLTDIGIQSRAPLMSKLDAFTRAAILFNYEGCRAYIVRKYPTIFPPGEGTGNGLAELEPVIKTAAGGKFGSFNETLTTSLYLILDHFRDELAEIERIKKSSKR